MNLIFNTAHEKFNLDYEDKQTLEDVCLLNKLPFQSINFYGIQNGDLTIITDIINTKISDLKIRDYDEIIFQPNRNINFSKIINKNLLIEKKSNSTTEYLFQSDNFDDLVNIEFEPQNCFNYIFEKVNSFLDNKIIDERPIIVGISGGGDSNTLLKTLTNSKKISNSQIIAVMCVGLEVWDTAIERAEYICSESNVELIFVGPKEICSIIGKRNSENWDNDFFDAFKDSDIDALGTFIVRKVLQFYVKKTNAQCMITGLNLEDLLAESIFQITKGKLPLPFPVRIIDEIPLWYPLYEIPKKILDGCYPKFSLQNYEQRNADKLINRAIPYYYSQMVSNFVPGFEFDLLYGFEKISRLNKEPFIFEPELGFSVTEKLPKELIERWLYYTHS